MIIRGKILAIGTAGIVALGGAGLYAGSLTATASGTLGAGEVAAQASCATDIAITPGLSAYDPTLEAFAFSDVDLAITEATNDSCDAKFADVTVYDSDDGSVVREGTAIEIDDENVDTSATANITLAGAVDSSRADLAYAVVIQDTNS